MNKEKLEVVSPGTRYGIDELDDVVIDTALGYPIEESIARTFYPVNRVSKNKIGDHETLRIYFAKKNKHFFWKTIPGKQDILYYYSDTIQIKPNVWYRASTESYDYNYYFFYDSLTKNSIHKLKSKGGAW